MDGDQRLANALQKHGIFIEKYTHIWKLSPADLSEEDKVEWFLEQLYSRGYISEELMDIIFEDFIAQPSSIQPLPPQPQQNQQSVGRYKILEQIGHGAMGVVYKAIDTALNCQVAIKTLSIQHQKDPKAIELLVREARAMAQIIHPNIVRFYEVGHYQNTHYLVMEYIAGTSLATWIKNKKIPVKYTLEVIYKIALALHEVHSNDIVHRDLKPDNIMIDDKGIPKLTDFGLAKIPEKSLNKSGAVVGTPMYMSPEQAQGKTKSINSSSDIYSLGAIMYEMLIYAPPFTGKTLEELFFKITLKDPTSPRKIRKNLHQDVETICLKCLEKQPQNRYTSAFELAADIKRFLNHQTILAKPDTLWQKLHKWTQRNSFPSKVIVFFCALIVAISVWYFVSLYKKQQQKTQQKQQSKLDLCYIILKRVEEASQQKMWHKSGVLCGRGLEILKTLKNKETAALRKKFDYYLQSSLFYYGLLWQYHFSKDTRVISVAFGPRAKYFLALTKRGKLYLWNFQNNTYQQIVPHHRGKITCATFYSKAPLLIFTGGEDGTVRIWDIKKQKEIRSFKDHATKVLFLRIGAKGAMLSASSQYIRIRNFISRRGMKIPIKAAQTHFTTQDACFSLDAKFMAFVMADECAIINLQTNKRVKNIKFQNNVISCYFTYGNKLICGLKNAEIQTLEVFPDIKKLNSFFLHQNPAHIIKTDEKNSLAISTAKSGKIRLWDNTGREVRSLQLHQSKISSFSPFFPYKLLISSSKNAIKVWYIPEISTWKRAHIHHRFLHFEIKKRRTKAMPLWHKSFLQKPHKSRFDSRFDVPGWLIEKHLQQNPQRTCELLFGWKVTAKLSIEPIDFTMYKN